MSSVKTLLQLTGRSYAPASLKNATLVVIDTQEEYRSGALRLPALESAVAEISRLLQQTREQQRPIVHVRHLGVPGGILDPSGPRGAHLPECIPQPGEVLIEKRLPNAFSNPQLHEQLQSIGNLDLIVVGFMTHSSVSTTVRAAKDYGYRVTLVESACATRDLPDRTGGSMPAEQVQRAELIALADNFACVVDNLQALN